MQNEYIGFGGSGAFTQSGGAGGGYLMPVTSDFLGAASFSAQRVDPASTPVPGTIWLLLSGLVGLGLWRGKSGRGPGRN
ncbi:MAG: hypothetical protein ACHQ2F_10905 [Desulfobaccales bacterium]